MVPRGNNAKFPVSWLCLFSLLDPNDYTPIHPVIFYTYSICPWNAVINTGNYDLLILSFFPWCFFLKHLGLGRILSTVKENGLTLKSRKYNFLTSFNQACPTNYTAEFPLLNVSSLWFFSVRMMIEWILTWLVYLEIKFYVSKYWQAVGYSWK